MNRLGRWKFQHLTVQQVYKLLAHSNGEILQLTRDKRRRADARSKALHQFLSEIGVKALRTHLGQLRGIAQVSDDKAQYEKNFEKVFGDRQRSRPTALLSRPRSALTLAQRSLRVAGARASTRPR